ncbi:hypothetical protein K1719_023987 [Acacia pycnantha]|nr:hypothetical protein K1719_023987 [Acacia pycnantha]
MITKFLDDTGKYQVMTFVSEVIPCYWHKLMGFAIAAGEQLLTSLLRGFILCSYPSQLYIVTYLTRGGLI